MSVLSLALLDFKCNEKVIDVKQGCHVDDVSRDAKIENGSVGAFVYNLQDNAEVCIKMISKLAMLGCVKFLLPEISVY